MSNERRSAGRSAEIQRSVLPRGQIDRFTSKKGETNEVRDEGPKSGASFCRLVKSTASNVKKGEVRDAALKSSGAFYRVVKSTTSRVKEKQMKCGMRDRNPVLHFTA